MILVFDLATGLGLREADLLYRIFGFCLREISSKSRRRPTLICRLLGSPFLKVLRQAFL